MVPPSRATTPSLSDFGAACSVTQPSCTIWLAMTTCLCGILDPATGLRSLHSLGLDPHKLSYPHQGLNERLIGPANDPRVHTQLFA